MAVVNTNVNASVAQNALVKNERNMNTAMERLSTGKRINSAKDDAAGLAISSRMTSQIRGLEVGVRNAGDAISMISVADGALVEVGNMLQRMRELALQAGNGTMTTADRSYLNSEYANLITEIERIAANTQWNGTNILNQASSASATFAYQVGANGGQTISVDFGAIDQTSGSAFTVFGGSAASIAFSNASAAPNSSGVLTNIDAAITELNEQRATFGAAINQLTYAIDNLSNVKVNSEAARSRIEDTDYAAETSELARTQIIHQAGVAMLAQANQVTATVLALLK
ncbi:MAG: flagellin [Proteobacteria bacterium]|nr:flagellin [Pseudomonadota bacterium]